MLSAYSRGDDPPGDPPDHGRAARPPVPTGASPGGRIRISPEDEPLLAELARDGRASNAAIATAIHWHESTVRRRIDELRRCGLLYFEVDVDNQVQGLNAHAVLWLSVEPARLEEAGQALAAHPEIPFAAATTGPASLVASAVFRDTQHLYEYLTGRLAALPGVTSVETAPIIRTLKRTGSVRWPGSRHPPPPPAPDQSSSSALSAAQSPRPDRATSSAPSEISS